VKDKLSRREREFLCPTPKLHSQLTRVDRDQESIGRDINKIAAAGLTGGKEADALALTPEEEHERAEAQTQAQVELVEGTMRAEKIDLQWASATKLTLNEVFHSEAMTGMQLVEADCRTTLCRRELVLDDSTSPEDSFRKLGNLAPWQGQAFGRINEGSAVVYLAREGYSLPQSKE